MQVSNELRMMTIHAHPDDESSKGAGSVALYSDAGVKATLVCCTGGEEGDILNPAMDLPEVRENIGDVRRQELAKAATIIGYDQVHYLEYRDSGMPESKANENPDCFANAPLGEAVERLVHIIRNDKPHVIVTYPDDQQGYQHPDHLKVFDISLPAWEAAGDPMKFPESGEPWTPLKLYYTTWSRARIEALHAMFKKLELESPFNDAWFDRPSQDHRITTKIDVSEYSQRRTDALLAHATQVDPDSPFWFGLPSEKSTEAYPWDDYILAFNRTGPISKEKDLFKGIS